MALCLNVNDLIEPFRPMVDIIAIKVSGNNVELTKPQRYKLAHILHNACMINNQKLNILNAIDMELKLNTLNLETSSKGMAILCSNLKFL